MKQFIAHIALVVQDYDEAINFFTRILGFELLEDTCQPEQDKRWVVVSPPGSNGTVAVFEDVCGNLWDLIQYKPDHPMAERGI